MQPMTENQNTCFPPLTPEQLQEIEESVPIARRKLMAHLEKWEATGEIGFPAIEDLEWPADELSPLNSA